MQHYYRFKNFRDCQESLDLINERMNWGPGKGVETWAQPLKNQINDEWIIPFDENQIGVCTDLLKKGELISMEEAQAQGWYFGSFKGTFAREKEKLEDVHFIFDALVASYGNPNFPATRSLILSFLSACYALKEALSKKINAPIFDNQIKEWWEIKKKEQDRRNELLKEYDIYMNTEKHGGASGGQSSKIRLEPISYLSGFVVTNYHPHADPTTMTLSSEGAFVTAYKDTPMERRFPVGIHAATYEIKVVGAPLKHLGQDISGATCLNQMMLIRNYYMQLIYDAELKIGERRVNTVPAVHFSGAQFVNVTTM